MRLVPVATSNDGPRRAQKDESTTAAPAPALRSGAEELHIVTRKRGSSIPLRHPSEGRRKNHSQSFALAHERGSLACFDSELLVLRSASAERYRVCASTSSPLAPPAAAARSMYDTRCGTFCGMKDGTTRRCAARSARRESDAGCGRRHQKRDATLPTCGQM